MLYIFILIVVCFVVEVFLESCLLFFHFTFISIPFRVFLFDSAVQLAQHAIEFLKLFSFVEAKSGGTFFLVANFDSGIIHTRNILQAFTRYL